MGVSTIKEYEDECMTLLQRLYTSRSATLGVRTVREYQAECAYHQRIPSFVYVPSRSTKLSVKECQVEY